MARRRAVLSLGVFALGTGAVAWGMVAHARETRLRNLLEEIVVAEERVPYAGTRRIVTSETVVLRVLSDGARRHVDIVEGKPALVHLPLFLQDRGDHVRRRIKDCALAVRNYEVVSGGRDRVAGRDAEIVELRPRDPGRAGYRIAADLVHRFPLRFQVLAGGATVFEAAFVEIAFRPEFAADAFKDAARLDWLRLERAELAGAPFPIFVPAALPRGFELRDAEVLHVKAQAPPELHAGLAALGFAPALDLRLVHHHYTDGMAVLSIVQSPATRELRGLLARLIPGVAPQNEVAQRFKDSGGAAYFLELEGTILFVAGNIPAEEIEAAIGSLSRR